MIVLLFFSLESFTVSINSPKCHEQNQEDNRHVTCSESMSNSVNVEARREALEGEYIFSSSSVDELMRFLDKDD